VLACRVVSNPDPKAPPRWHEWLIGAAFFALTVTGILTVFDDEIDRLRGAPQKPADPATTVEQGGVPLAPGNTPPGL
jgi:hypothetical protein